MKSTSILIPIILIACLLALAYLITQAFQDGRVNTDAGTSDRIVLDPEDYRTEDESPTDIGTNTNTDAASLDDYFQEAGAPGDDNPGPDRDDTDDYGDTNSPEYATDPVAPNSSAGTGTTTAPAAPASSPTTTRPATASAEGRYLVIAGSFRQLANAEERVRNLRRAGFTDSRLERFNRGTFAVALAGQSNSYATATRMVERIRAAGFEARVMRRR